MQVSDLVSAQLKTIRLTTKSPKGRPLSQERLGAALEPLLGRPWSRQEVWDAENGKRRLSVSEIAAFAVALEHPVTAFFTPVANEAVDVGSRRVTAAHLVGVPEWSPSSTWSEDAVAMGVNIFNDCTSALHLVEELQKNIKAAAHEASKLGKVRHAKP